MTQRLSKPEFALLFEEASRPLWCIAAAVLGDPALADDAVQEAALIGLKKIDDFAPGTSFAAWMGQIVRNVARNHGRRRLRGPKMASEVGGIEPLVETRPGRSETPVTVAGVLREDQISFDDDMIDALNSLNETARTCLLLRTVLETPYRQIAEIVGVPEGTAMSHVHRARQELRRTLTGQEPGSTREPHERQGTTPR